MRSILPNGVHVMALTATATKSLQSEVAEILGMMNTISLAVSPCEANIMYAVGEYSNISETFKPLLLRLRKDRTKMPRTIIYCRRQEECADLYLFFRDGLGSEFTEPCDAPDHSGFRLVDMFTSCTDSDVKSDIISSFTVVEGTLRIVCATIAFGLGIDCPDVRQVFHVGAPADIVLHSGKWPFRTGWESSPSSVARGGNGGNCPPSQYPLALYTHCTSHCLNLAVVASFEEVSVRNMIGVVNRVSVFFFAHPKRQNKLEEAIQNTQPESKVVKLKNLCRTRWIERINALDRIKNLHSSIVACFESISSEGSRMWSPDSVTDASTLLQAIITTEFLSALVITNGCLQYLRGLTISLQEEAKDIVQAVSEIKTVTSSLEQVRENVDSYHSRWFETISEICREVGVIPSMPRICSRQHHRANTPASDPSEYFRRNITVPILDHLLAEFDRRFSLHQRTAFQGFYLVPSVLVKKDLETVSDVLMKVGEYYDLDLPNISSLCGEIHNWYSKWKSEEENHGLASLPSTLSSTLPRISSFFPNIKVLATILCTLPVTSCSAERSFSGLKRIKTALRSSMSNERLSNLTLLHMHPDVPIDIEEVINEFSRRHPRRITLI